MGVETRGINNNNTKCTCVRYSAEHLKITTSFNPHHNPVRLVLALSLHKCENQGFERLTAFTKTTELAGG